MGNKAEPFRIEEKSEQVVARHSSVVERILNKIYGSNKLLVETQPARKSAALNSVRVSLNHSKFDCLGFYLKPLCKTCGCCRVCDISSSKKLGAGLRPVEASGSCLEPPASTATVARRRLMLR